MGSLQDEINSAAKRAVFKNKRTNVYMEAIDLNNSIFGGINENDFGEAFNQYSNWEPTLDCIKSELTNQIYSTFSDFIEVDIHGQRNIGIGYNFLNSTPRIISVLNFTQEIIRASVVLGTDTIIELLNGWINRVPLTLSLKCKIIGLSVCKTITLTDSTRILPSSYQSPEHIKNQSANLSYQFADSPIKQGLEDLDTLAFDFEIPNGLFLPSNTQAHYKNRERIDVASRCVNQMCETLSLASDSNISYNFNWFDAGNSVLFFSGASVIFFAGNSVDSKKIDEGENTIQCSKELQHSAILFLNKRDEVRKNNPIMMLVALDISIFRLVESMRIADDLNQVNNRCIDMRIALESLFLYDKSKSKNSIWFLVPANCTCLLDENPSDKCESYRIIEDFYDIASRILHSSEGTSNKHFINSVEKRRNELTDKNKSIAEDELEMQLINQKLQSLKSAQKICSLAIKKILDHGSIPCWDELILKYKDNFSKYRGN